MGPVSGTGRAMMASLNNAVEKGMPVDQAIAYVKSMAKDGVAPLVDLYALLNQYQRMQQKQVQPPQTPPTIRDQVMAASQAPQAMPSPMEQGLGGMNSGVMENAQFAGGGIVAFEGGGNVQNFQAGGATWEMNLIRDLRARGLSVDEINRIVAEERVKRDVALGRTADDRMPYEVERKQADKLRDIDLDQARKLREREYAAARAEQEARLGGKEAPASSADVDTPSKAPQGRMRRLAGGVGRLAGIAGLGLGFANMLSSVGEKAESRTGEGTTDEPIIPIGPMGVAYSTRTAPTPRDVGSMLTSALGFGGGETEAEETPTIEEISIDSRKREMPAQAPAPSRAAPKMPASKALSFIDSAIGRLQEEGPDALSEEQSAEVAKKLADLPAQRRKDTYLALAQAGFSMAEAASKPGAKFLGALGAGGKEASRLLTTINKDLRDVENDLRKEMFAIEREGARITRDRENKIMDLQILKQKMQEDRNALAAQLEIRREELGVRQEEAAATRGETALYRTENLINDRLRSDPEILAISAQFNTPTKRTPEETAALQNRLNARIQEIRAEVEGRMGTGAVPVAQPASGQWGTPRVVGG